MGETENALSFDRVVRPSEECLGDPEFLMRDAQVCGRDDRSIQIVTGGNRAGSVSGLSNAYLLCFRVATTVRAEEGGSAPSAEERAREVLWTCELPGRIDWTSAPLYSCIDQNDPSMSIVLVNQVQPVACHVVDATTGDMIHTFDGIKCLSSPAVFPSNADEFLVLTDGDSLFRLANSAHVGNGGRTPSLTPFWKGKGAQIVAACNVERPVLEERGNPAAAQVFVLCTAGRRSASLDHQSTARTQAQGILLTESSEALTWTAESIFGFESTDRDLRGACVEALSAGNETNCALMLPRDRAAPGRLGFFTWLNSGVAGSDIQWANLPCAQPLNDEMQRLGNSGVIWADGQSRILMITSIGHASGSRVLCFDMRTAGSVYDWRVDSYAPTGTRLQRIAGDGFIAAGGDILNAETDRNGELRLYTFTPGVLRSVLTVHEAEIRKVSSIPR